MGRTILSPQRQAEIQKTNIGRLRSNMKDRGKWCLLILKR